LYQSNTKNPYKHHIMACILRNMTILLPLLMTIVSIQALGTGLKGSSRPLKSSYMDTITAKALRVQKEIDNVWPHNRLGYTIDGSSLHKHRELSDFEESVNFIQATTCGQNTQEFLEEIGIEFDRIATGFAADTCLACKNSNDPSVISCKYEVQSSSPVLNYKFYTYTSDDCSDGKEMKEEMEFEVGQCLTEDYGSVTFTYLEQISSPSELGSGQILMGFQSNPSNCKDPFLYYIVGWYNDVCINGEDIANLVDDDDQADDDNTQDFSVTLSCNDNQVSITGYVGSNCKTNSGTETIELGQCNTADDDQATIFDETTGFRMDYKAMYCYSLDSKGNEPKSNALTGGAIAGITIGVLAACGCAAGLAYYLLVVMKNKKGGMATQEVQNSSLAPPVKYPTTSSGQSPVTETSSGVANDL